MSVCPLRGGSSGRGEDPQWIREVQWADWSRELRTEDDVWAVPGLRMQVPRQSLMPSASNPEGNSQRVLRSLGNMLNLNDGTDSREDIEVSWVTIPRSRE